MLLARLFKLSLILVIVLGIILAVPLYMTRNDKACSSCHEMKPYYDLWKISTHGASGCDCCHLRRIIFIDKNNYSAKLMYRFTFYREIYARLTGVDLNPFFPSADPAKSCSGCHVFPLHNAHIDFIDRFDAIIIHAMVTHTRKLKLECTECHINIGHVVGYGDDIDMSKGCKPCHAKKMDDCKYCHPENIPLEKLTH